MYVTANFIKRNACVEGTKVSTFCFLAQIQMIPVIVIFEKEINFVSSLLNI